MPMAAGFNSGGGLFLALFKKDELPVPHGYRRERPLSALVVEQGRFSDVRPPDYADG
jgi:hypothetical protein